MFIKSICATTLLSSIALITTPEAIAMDIPFEVAIVKNSTGSNEIMSGKYKAGIKKLMRKSKADTMYEYDVNMGLCVAYLKTNNLSKAESSCTAAINTIESLKSRHNVSDFYKSISYSNRAVSRYLNDDFSGAIKDFNKAFSLDKNRIVINNRKLILEHSASIYGASPLQANNDISE